MIMYAYGGCFGAALRDRFHAVGQDLIPMFGGERSLQAGGEKSCCKINFGAADSEMMPGNVALVAAVSAETLLRMYPPAGLSRCHCWREASRQKLFGEILPDGVMICDHWNCTFRASVC
jgi:hypothetical protein